MSNLFLRFLILNVHFAKFDISQYRLVPWANDFSLETLKIPSFHIQSPKN